MLFLLTYQLLVYKPGGQNNETVSATPCNFLKCFGDFLNMFGLHGGPKNETVCLIACLFEKPQLICVFLVVMKTGNEYGDPFTDFSKCKWLRHFKDRRIEDWPHFLDHPVAFTLFQL